MHADPQIVIAIFEDGRDPGIGNALALPHVNIPIAMQAIQAHVSRTDPDVAVRVASHDSDERVCELRQFELLHPPPGPSIKTGRGLEPEVAVPIAANLLNRRRRLPIARARSIGQTAQREESVRKLRQGDASPDEEQMLPDLTAGSCVERPE